MVSPSPTLSLQVTEARLLNPLIRTLVLRDPGGARLPGFDPGSHIRVHVTLLDGQKAWRAYSLIDPVAGGNVAPAEYRIAVLLENAGRGGSRFMHDRLQVGDLLKIESPKNEFPLGDHIAPAVLIAGGIGVTPLISMAARRRAAGASVRMHYAGRSRAVLAYLSELELLLGDELDVHADNEVGAALDVGAVLDRYCPDDHLYVCGPRAMLDAVLDRAQVRGWPSEHVHFELFAPQLPTVGDKPFEVVLARSGERYTVTAHQTILDCLIESGCEPLFDCKRGECGICSTPVLEGDIEHRDYFLSKAERASGKVIQICISRARGERLVLDI